MDRNIVLIVLDTVRKDYFDEYAPRLQELGDVTFEQCRAASSTSVPSHASLVTGELPHRHGIHSFNPYFDSLNVSDTFLDGFDDYRTVGVSANAFAGSSFGFDRLFDDFTDIAWTGRLPDGMDVKEYAMKTDNDGFAFYTGFLQAALEHDHPLQSIANAALAQIDDASADLPFPRLFDDGAKAILNAGESKARESEPFLMFINLMEAHAPHRHTRGFDRSIHGVSNGWSTTSKVSMWEATVEDVDEEDEDLEKFRRLYAASIDYLDREVSAFIERVREATERETTFVITADHGENLAFEDDRGILGHKSSLTEALLHVPLTIVNPPEGYDERETGYFSHLQMGELLTGMARGETPDVFSDRIPAERIGTANGPDSVSEAERAYWTRMLRCVYEGERKWVWDSLDECVPYAIDWDRPCRQRITEDEECPPGWVDEFFDGPIREYQSESATDDSPHEDVDDATKSRLKELGYL